MPPYIKEPRGGGGRPRRGAPRGSPTPTGSRTPSWTRREGKAVEERKEKGGGAPPPFPCPIRTRKGGGVRPPPASFSLLPQGPCRPNNPRGVPVTPRYSGKIPISPGTFPISKYRLPIYQSLCLDHFETPRHVRDHIRDTEQPLLHQNTKNLITIVTEL